MSGKIVSDVLFSSLIFYTDYLILPVFACLGLVTNVLNLIVFTRLGYKDSVNISMTCIALWDLVKCVGDMVARLDKLIGLASHALGVSFRSIVYLFLGYNTHPISNFVSWALATYISVERCLCVCMPFTVRSVLTPKFTFLMVTAISVVVFGAFAVMYFIWDIVQIYSPEFNTTVLVFVYSDLYHKYGHVVIQYYQVMGILFPFTSFLILCMYSFVTVHCLRKSARYFHENVTSMPAAMGRGVSRIGQREKKVATMLLVIIAVYIANLFPRIVCFIAQLTEPELHVNRLYNNLFHIISMSLMTLDILNASVNLFIFLKMSSNFRAAFLSLFPWASKCC